MTAAPPSSSAADSSPERLTPEVAEQRRQLGDELAAIAFRGGGKAGVPMPAGGGELFRALQGVRERAPECPEGRLRAVGYAGAEDRCWEVLIGAASWEPLVFVRLYELRDEGLLSDLQGLPGTGLDRRPTVEVPHSRRVAWRGVP
jgi:hypothetical protein